MCNILYSKYFKRLLDIIISLVIIFLFWWLILIVAILVKIFLGSPVIFKQERPGKDEKIFTLYKFRTMTDEKDSEGNLLPDEKRLNKFGKFLRSTSLDELPEIINVLKGEMSFVGPRPLLVEYLELYDEKQKYRHKVRPGLTGLAQINGRNDTTWEARLNYDVEYVKNVTFMNDMEIIFKTIKLVFTRKGVNEKGSVTMTKFTGNKIENEKKEET